MTAMPKVNVRPASLPATALRQAETSPRPASMPQASLPSAVSLSSVLRGKKDWDVKFAVALIVLVVLVNLTLTLLLGGEDEQETPAIIMQHADEEDRSRTVTEQNAMRPTQVYISNQDKRLLLRQLNTPTDASAEDNRETGSYRSIGQAPALSILDRRSAAGE